MKTENLLCLKIHNFNALGVSMSLFFAFLKSLIMNIFKLRFIERHSLSISLGKEKDKLIYC